MLFDNIMPLSVFVPSVGVSDPGDKPMIEVEVGGGAGSGSRLERKKLSPEEISAMVIELFIKKCFTI